MLPEKCYTLKNVQLRWDAYLKLQETMHLVLDQWEWESIISLLVRTA